MNHWRSSSFWHAALYPTGRAIASPLILLAVLALLALSKPVVRGTDLVPDPALEQLLEDREDLANRSKWPEATAAAEKVVQMERQKWGEQNCETAEAMYRLGYLANCACQPAKAEQVWLDALSIQENSCGKDTVSTARTLRSLGFLYQSKPGDRRWEGLLERARRILEARLGADSLDVAQVTCGLGFGYYYRGELAKAQSAAANAAQICERTGNGETRHGEYALLLLGGVSVSLHDYPAAERSYLKVIASRTKRLGASHVDTAEGIEALACVYGHQERFEEAEVLYDRSLEIQEHAWAQYERQNLFTVLHGFGEMYLAWRKLDKAEIMLRRARDVIDPSQLWQKRKASLALFSLGGMYEHRRDYQKAYELVETAVGLRNSDFGPLNAPPAEWLLRLAQIEYESGRGADALRRAQAVEDAEDQQLKEVLTFTSETERLSWQREQELGSSLNLWASLGAPDPLLRCVLRNKAVVLDSLIEEKRIEEASRDKTVRDLVEHLKQARTRAACLVALELGGGASGSVDFEAKARAASAEVDALEANLARKVTGLESNRLASVLLCSDVQAALPEHAVLVEMVRYRRLLDEGATEDSYGTILLSHSGPPKWIPLGPAATVDRSIAIYKHVVRGPGAPDQLVQTLKTLHLLLWKPIEAQLPPDAKQIVFSPDSELNFVSFSTLLEPNGCFLGENYTVNYVSSGRDLLMKRNEPREPGQLTILANPDFGTHVEVASGGPKPAESGANLFRGLNFQALPGAEREGLWLRERAKEFGFTRAALYMGPQATKRELLAIHSPEVLHLATHGFVLPGQTSTSSDLSDGGNASNASSHALANPMLRSGLALAGAESAIRALAQGEEVSPEDNGIVTAEEISCLDLRGTKLVVLSACDTGLGDAYAGEGVLGLRYGFAEAGAQNLLLTLWPVQDGTTSRVMMDFYTCLSKSASPAEALATTQRAWLRRLREEKGIADACRIAGPFVLSSRGQSFSAMKMDAKPTKP